MYIKNKHVNSSENITVTCKRYDVRGHPVELLITHFNLRRDVFMEICRVHPEITFFNVPSVSEVR